MSKIEKQTLLWRFHYPTRKTGTTEEQAVDLLSKFPNPEAVRSIKDNNWSDSRDCSLLHHACNNKWYEVVRLLITKYKCEPYIKDKNGETPLYWACRIGDLKIVQYLIGEHLCDPKSKNGYWGWTCLHIACAKGHLDIAMYLVSKCNCDPLITDKDGDTPLSRACYFGHYNIVLFLLTTGKFDKEILKFQSTDPSNQTMQDLIRYRKSHPFHPAFKVFVVGNYSAGKSTLVKALKSKLSDNSFLGLRSVTSHFRQKVSGVELRTAGIVHTHIHSPQLGRIIIYDFAGQYEYYSSHSACLENLVSSHADGVLFLLVVDISKDTEEIVRILQYWSSFIDNLCNRCDKAPQIILIGSHADVVKSQGKQPSEILSAAYNKLDNRLASSLKESKVVLNCTQAASSSLSFICNIIAKSSQTFRKDFEVDMQVHLLNGVIESMTGIATTFRKIFHHLWSEENAGFHELLSSDDTTLSQHLTTLSEHGQLIYLRNDDNIHDSWVILNKELLLSQVNGTIFAPENFKQHHDISSSTGVVPLSEIKKIFPEHDPQMIVGFLTHLEFCHRIGKSEASLISRGFINSSDTQSESYYFFPALVSEERPEESCTSIIQAGHKSGWCLQRRQDHQFFTLRFLHVLLLQLAFHFALTPESSKEESSCPVVQRECNVWKNGLTDGGIHWLTMDGVVVVVEVVEQSTGVTVVVGCQEGGEMASVQLRSALIRAVLEVKEKYSGAVEVRESLISPSELQIYPLKSLKELSTFSIEKIAKAVAQEKMYLTLKQGPKQESILIANLLYFEPFSSLSAALLEELFDESKELDPRFLNKLGKAMQKHTKEFQQTFQVKAQTLKDAIHSSPPSVRDDPAHHCYLVLKIWKEQGHRSYGDLRSALSKFSVFSERNPLALAGVSTRSTNDAQVPDHVDFSYPVALNPNLNSTTTTENDILAEFHESEMTQLEEHSEINSGEHVTSLPQKSDRPTLKDLLLLKCRGGRRLRVLDSVAADWKYLATYLGFEEPVIRSIEMGAFFQPEDACRQVFTKWLDGGDGLCEPVTWATLIQCLIDAGLVDIAEQLEEILSGI